MDEGSVRAQLLARVDEITGRLTELVDEVRTVTEQRARSCRNAKLVAPARLANRTLASLRAS